MSLMLVITVTADNLTPPTSQPENTPQPIRLKSGTRVPAVGLSTLSFGTAQHGLVQLSGAITPELKEALTAEGVTLLHYVPDNTWLADLPGADSMPSVLAMEEVLWAGYLRPADKVDGLLATDGSMAVDVWVTLFADEDVAKTADTLQTTFPDSTLTRQMADNQRLALTLPQEQLLTLAANDAVLWIEPAPLLPEVANNNVRTSLNVEKIAAAPYGLTGVGQAVGIWDSGLADMHPDFDTRMTQVDLASAISNHATHVTGTVGGSGSYSATLGYPAQHHKGVAPNADLYSYYWDDPFNDVAAAKNAYDIAVSQNSWGLPGCNYGDYNAFSIEYDKLVAGEAASDAVSVVFAAGNKRNTCDREYQSIYPGPQASKNVITVGAVDHLDNAVLVYSAIGPATDGRLKPEVMALGTVYSTTTNSTYGASYGTSMAAPAVSGTIALIHERQNAICQTEMIPSTTRGILIHSATDLNDETDDMVNLGPDFTSGFGLTNAKGAIDIVPFYIEETLTNGQMQSYTISVTQQDELKVTLTWDDPSSSEISAVQLINNLDLELVDPNGTVYGPWILDHTSGNERNPAVRTTWTDPANAVRDIRNVVEQVTVDEPIAGEWTVNVIATNIPDGSQTFSLVNDLLSSSSCTPSTATSDVHIDAIQSTVNSPVAPTNPDPSTWTSEDIWVRNQADGETNQLHQNPIALERNFVYVNVENIGTEQLDNVRAYVYWADTDGTSPEWPHAWNLIGEMTVANLAAGDSRVTEGLEWTPDAPYNGLYADVEFYVRLVTDQDEIGVEGSDIEAVRASSDNVAIKSALVIDPTVGVPTAVSLSQSKAIPRMPLIRFTFATILLALTGVYVASRKRLSH